MFSPFDIIGFIAFAFVVWYAFPEIRKLKKEVEELKKHGKKDK